MKRWTREDDAVAMRARSGEYTFAEAAELLGRSEKAVRCRVWVLAGGQDEPLVPLPHAAAPAVAATPPGGVEDDQIPGSEALRSRSRQLAACLGEASVSVYLLRREHGFTELALAALLLDGKRWFESTALGVRLTALGRGELLGRKAAA